ncbi:MAG TPA: HAMP domain-containing sensor histidine kinase [Gaiellaceae bacterium]|nr:HAMP domain-containing sensor histidine kinase [Gaiellaceae bacterium]
MFRSLRFRLPALFLAAIVLAGLVSTAVAVSVSKRYADHTLRDQAFTQLDREASGIDQIYTENAGDNPPDSDVLERASGDQVFVARRARGIDVFPGPTPAYTLVSRHVLDFTRILAGHTVRFEFTPPGSHTRFLAVGRPVKLGDQIFGAVILARPKTELDQSWLPLTWRLLPAFFAGILVAGALGWYLSRRITKPVLALSDAADEVAAGRYGVVVPDVPGRGEISHLSERFREMASQLEEAEALERNFLMTVSHELRTPLTAIRGHVAALLEGVVEDEEARTSSLEVINLEADRLERLVGDVLDLAKLDTHRFALVREEVDMERLIDRAYSTFGEEARRRGIEYARSVAAKPVLETDGDRVLQVITNLLSNAFRWTPDGGRVGLALTQVDGTIRVAVDDSGPGIPNEQRDRIFRPFWSRDGDGGTGLGLAIARELATALGGEIELETAPGEGSRFEFVLPARPVS